MSSTDWRHPMMVGNLLDRDRAGSRALTQKSLDNTF
jgi:hypothetical protein